MSAPPPPQPRVPRSTYRLQITPTFDLDAATAALDVLARLGVSHVYLSPILAAAPGSEHGYDVVDPTRVDDARGGEAAFARFVAAARATSLGVVVDVVPNHVAVLTDANPAWVDVLRHGPESPHATAFDIDWSPSPTGVPQVVLPILGGDLDEVIDELQLTSDADGRAVLSYHEHRVPIRPGTLEVAGLDPATQPIPAGPLRALLDEQHYRLAYWRTGTAELNYRRFFDITTLAGVRVEDPAVADWVLGRTVRMLAEGDIDGIRIDHPDGMRDPAAVFARLRDAAPDAWIVVEKILEPGEPRRAGWPVDGDVGYRFLNATLGLLVDPAAEHAFTTLSSEVTGRSDDHETIVRAAKGDVVDSVLVPERRLLERLLAAAAADAGTPASEDAIRATVRALLVAFPVYRTYVVPERDEVDDDDRAAVSAAIAAARSHVPADCLPLVDLLARILVLEHRSAAADELTARFQQVTGPVMAKGLEDTAFYRDHRFVALNEVGGDPGRFGIAVDEFHATNQERQTTWPRAMVTTSTHDTKRSEDVRARLAVLSEIPELWRESVHAWRDGCSELRGPHGPSAGLAYLAWQTCVGAWPLDGDRLAAYLHKAAREEKRETSWLDPDEAYEADVERYARSLVGHPGFTEPLRRLLDVVLPAGRVNVLSQTLVRLTVPGVPDTYQGCELWDLSLVDPDNRRPVDHDRIASSLARLEAGVAPAELTATLTDPNDPGLAKLWVVRQGLQLRRQYDLTLHGYRPLVATGDRSAHVVAFARGPDVVVVVPRLTVALGRVGAWDWGATAVPIPEGRWTDRLTGDGHVGGAVRLDRLLGSFPVALLVRDTAHAGPRA